MLIQPTKLASTCNVEDSQGKVQQAMMARMSGYSVREVPIARGMTLVVSPG